MRYRRAIEKLRILAEACESARKWPLDDPFLREAYVFGEVLKGTDPLEFVEIALVLNLRPEEVPWESHPPGTAWIAELLRLDNGGIAYWWRSHLGPVGNHLIRTPVRFWSLAGTDEAVLQALAERRLDDLAPLSPSAQPEREQLSADLAEALSRLRAVRDSYWDHDWRREHRGLGRYPENHLWEAVHGYLDLHDADSAN